MSVLETMLAGLVFAGLGVMVIGGVLWQLYRDERGRVLPAPEEDE